MPQFELATFFIQVFWLIVGFFFFFFFYVKIILPSFFFSFKFREKIEILNTVKSPKFSLNYFITQIFKSTSI